MSNEQVEWHTEGNKITEEEIKGHIKGAFVVLNLCDLINRIDSIDVNANSRTK